MRCLRIFFFNDTATTEIYTLSLHDALPILSGAVRPRHAHRDVVPSGHGGERRHPAAAGRHRPRTGIGPPHRLRQRSEEHTSELQSRQYLVCRLLLEKKKKSTWWEAA